MKYDVIIAGGIVVDGTEAPGRRADVGIKGDRIAAVEPGLVASGGADGSDGFVRPDGGAGSAHVLDATGLIVCGDLSTPTPIRTCRCWRILCTKGRFGKALRRKLRAKTVCPTRLCRRPT